MVTAWGMSDRLGPIYFADDDAPVFMGRDLQTRPKYSAKTAVAIDEEVHRIVNSGYERAKKILSDHRAELELMAEALLERETLDGEEVMMILAGKELPPLHEDDEPSVTRPQEDPAVEEPEAEDSKGLGGPILGGEMPPPTAS